MWNEKLEDKALKLIFGEKKYCNFTCKEKRIVDSYQQRILEEAPLILPNTAADLEKREIEQLLASLNHSKE